MAETKPISAESAIGARSAVEIGFDVIMQPPTRKNTISNECAPRTSVFGEVFMCLSPSASSKTMQPPKL